MSEKEFAAILARFLKGNSSPSETRQVEEWLDAMDEEGELPLTNEQKMHAKQQVWRTLEERTQRTRRSRKVVSWAMVGVAASLVLWALAIQVFEDPVPSGTVLTAREADQNSYFSQETNPGPGLKEISFADGSTVGLGPGSSLTFNDMKGDSVRLVTLEGEAFFDVARDENRPFYVFTEGLVTKVLGTSFSIVSRGKGSTTTVSVSSGRVSVFSKDRDREPDATRLILHPNQQATFDPVRKELTASLVAEPKVIRKRTQERLIFDEVAVSAVLDSIQQNFGVPIVYDSVALRHCSITTAFIDEGLYEQLDVVSRIVHGTYVVEGTGIRFTSKGCN